MYKLSYLYVNIMLYVNPKLIYLSLPPTFPLGGLFEEVLKPSLDSDLAGTTLAQPSPGLGKA